jgi:hypothetical protein
MDEAGVQALVDHITESPGIFLKGAEWRVAEEDADRGALRYLYCTLPDGRKRRLRLLSESEIGAVLVNLAVARAKKFAINRPTLLIIDRHSFSRAGAGKLLSLFLNALSSPVMPFQTIVVSNELEDNVMWGGWQVIRLSQPRDGGTEVVVGDMYGAAKAE